ncbi:MAG: hypothetical protein CAF45_011805 [Nitrospira sp. CG24E]|nr:MAG: hypothetical protein CAF45_011805 [Nitrospira sp. CG24E]
MDWIRWISIVLVMNCGLGSLYSLGHTAEVTDAGTWKTYTNTRFGFSVRYPPDWRPGNPTPGGTGITFSPPTEDTQVALFGFMNVIEGNSPDRRQTLEEFVMAHRRIITELFEKKHIKVSWETDHPTKLGGFDAKRLTFTYRSNTNTEMREIHIMSVGRNEGRGVRIKIPASDTGMMIPLVMKLLETYQPGRDQNAVSPFAPARGDQPSTPPR